MKTKDILILEKSKTLLSYMTQYIIQWNRLEREYNSIHWIWEVIFPVGFYKKWYISNRMSKLTAKYSENFDRKLQEIRNLKTNEEV